ncbi:DEAD-box ATP-dependent RNA helicase 47A [Prunus yedoensis var. nudiflora]|uniref:RNA helicase n=1 Tax=Prunus yedoensis var. nudiflora TaxID=2094558 RepID=A0A314YJX0_PRUYE|nr:DEAD-box ATP-dependent RNA helicase 47A [Prunus yedoensis var. nudiflora]
MPALISPRLLLFGESLSFHKFPHVSRNAWFHRSVCSLSLASLGFKNDHETVETGKFNEAKLLNSLTEVPKSKAKVVRSHVVKAAGPHRSLEIDSTIFNAKSFFELGLPPLLIERLEKEGFKTPTDVQATAIPTILKDHDVVIQSYTGSGKTLAYLLPILSEVGPLKTRTSDGDGDGEPGKKTDIEAVIVAPSRSWEEALRKNKPCIVVGTPGRISEISAAGKLHTHGCRFLVLDEVDQLLSFNFREDMHRILEHVGRKSSGDSRGPKGSLAKRAERQTVLVSATVPFSVIRAARSWGHDPLLIQAKKVISIESISPSGPINLSGQSTSSDPSSNVQTQAAIQSLPPSLKHYYCVTKLQHKVDTLRRCVHALDAKSVIVFMNHTKQLKDTVFKLEARGMIAAELHGDLGKLGRTTTLKKFKNGEVRILVTNELSARGLDVAECDLVVNLDLPTDSIHYAHRAGRTGRLGRGHCRNNM